MYALVEGSTCLELTQRFVDHLLCAWFIARPCAYSFCLFETSQSKRYHLKWTNVVMETLSAKRFLA